MAILRGCGERKRGALYVEVGLHPRGRPLEEFLCDPPIPVDPDALGLAAQGVQLIKDERTGTVNVWDIVGGKYYPNVSDMIEEIRRYGVSRRISSKVNFSQLTADSRLVLLHSRAYIKNFNRYGSECSCPLDRPGHEGNKAMCIKLFWEDITGGESSDGRNVVRKMPSFTYKGLSRPPSVEPNYQTAIFASFPITRLVAVRDNESRSHEAALGAARRSQITVDLVDE
jgi:hypothetical protein